MKGSCGLLARKERNTKVLSKILNGLDLSDDLDGMILLNGSYTNG